MMARTQWTPMMDAQLRTLVKDGVPHSEISKRLGVTRNASIGRANRIGLSDPNRDRRSVSRMAVHNLRAKGLTYRQIAQIVGCSPHYAWQIGSGYLP